MQAKFSMQELALRNSYLEDRRNFVKKYLHILWVVIQLHTVSCKAPKWRALLTCRKNIEDHPSHSWANFFSTKSMLGDRRVKHASYYIVQLQQGLHCLLI